MDWSRFISKSLRGILGVGFGAIVLSGCGYFDFSSGTALSSWWPSSSSSSHSSVPQTSSSSSSSSSSEEQSRYFVVTFLNFDGTFLYETTTLQGQVAIYQGPVPTRESEGGFVYTFTGWNKSLDNIQDNETFVAQYVTERAGFTVRFYNYDQTLLDVEKVSYGDTAIYAGDPPERPATAESTYVFQGWNLPLSNITSNRDFTAVYTETVNSFPVVFKNYDGTVLQTRYIAYGKEAVFSGVTPVKPISGRYCYTFSGWDIDLTHVVSPLVATAQYSESVRSPSSSLRYWFDQTNKQYTVNSFSGNDTDVYVGLTYNDGTNGEAPVVAIGQGAFNWQYNIKSIYLEDNIQRIEASAFYGCQNLSSVRLSQNLMAIRSSAFRSTSALTKLELPKSVNSIEPSAFYDVNSNFQLSIDQDNPTYCVNGHFVCSADKETIYFGYAIPVSTALVIPEGTKTIGSNAFANFDQILSVSFPSSLTSIQNRAFYDCDRLTTLVFNDCPVAIGEQAFYDDSVLTTIDFGSALLSLGDNSFSNCPRLVSISLPASLLSCSKRAFASCSSLTSISVAAANSVYSSDDGVLYSKDQTQMVIVPLAKTGALTLPAALTNLSFSELSDATNITSFLVASGNLTYSSYNGVLMNASQTQVLLVPDSATSFICPASVTLIGSLAFYQSKIAAVTLNEGLTEIGSNAFNNCPDLTTIAFPASLVQIDYGAFQNSGLTELTIPATITSFSDYVFKSCRSLTKVTINSSVLGYNTFGDCTSLQSVTLNGTLNEFPGYLFGNCSSLTSIVIPDSVTRINSSCFQDCRSLKTVTLGANLNQIDSWAFSGCSSLAEVKMNSKLTTVSSYAFYQCALPSIVLPTTVTYFDSGVFNNNTAMKTIFFLGTSSSGYSWLSNVPSRIKILYYSATEQDDGFHWHYVDGTPTLWVASTTTTS
jgi:hypothetical protein